MRISKCMGSLVRIAALIALCGVLSRTNAQQQSFNGSGVCVIPPNNDTTTYPLQWTVDKTSIFWVKQYT